MAGEGSAWRFSRRTLMVPISTPRSSKRERRKKRWCGVRVSLAGLILCDVKLNAPKEKAAAKAFVVEV